MLTTGRKFIQAGLQPAAPEQQLKAQRAAEAEMWRQFMKRIEADKKVAA